MVNSYGQFTVWVSVSSILKFQPNCMWYKLCARFQRWHFYRGLVMENALMQQPSHIWWPSVNPSLCYQISPAGCTPSGTKYVQQGAFPLVTNIYSRVHFLCYQITPAGSTPSATKYLQQGALPLLQNIPYGQSSAKLSVILSSCHSVIM